ncbi:MAG: peroxiredoxin [Gammaproteobacteria bacterium]|nr:peroxiredoxin [Gammaproteobacteria bacterium]NNF67861.1 peroxiredoxin [Gammaproteobacteria bacterium]
MRKLTSVLILLLFTGPLLAAPEIGDMAPGFHLQDQNGKWHSPEDYKGRWVALYFYPKNDTPGCTTEACAFRDDIFKFKKMNVAILGVSLDDVDSHKEFAKKYSLPFPLLADIEREASGAYDVVRDLGFTSFAKRETFIIDPDNRIAAHYEKVNPDKHSAEVLADLEQLIAARSQTE